MIHRLLAVALAVLALPALAACGDGHDGAGGARTATAAAATPVSAPAAYLDRHALALQLGNGFRAALDRLAVLDQPREGATDLGQDLPSGLLRDVRCDERTARPTDSGPWLAHCRVRWETLRGTAKTTNYDARSLADGCFAAAATPAEPKRFDPTIDSYAENPLNAITSIRKGC